MWEESQKGQIQPQQSKLQFNSVGLPCFLMESLLVVSFQSLRQDLSHASSSTPCWACIWVTGRRWVHWSWRQAHRDHPRYGNEWEHCKLSWQELTSCHSAWYMVSVPLSQEWCETRGLPPLPHSLSTKCYPSPPWLLQKYKSKIPFTLRVKAGSGESFRQLLCVLQLLHSAANACLAAMAHPQQWG